jgi:hypothetical protein
MTVQLSTVLDAPSERIWAEVNRTVLHAYLTRPLLTFEPVDPPTLPDRWEEREYRVRMKLFGAVPLGWQIVKVERPATDGAKQHIRDNGRGALIRRWDHLITIEPAGPQRTRYTDRVEVEAGLLTPLVWAFARVFYAHRQRRWQHLVAHGFRYDDVDPAR